MDNYIGFWCKWVIYINKFYFYDVVVKVVKIVKEGLKRGFEILVVNLGVWLVVN